MAHMKLLVAHLFYYLNKTAISSGSVLLPILMTMEQKWHSTHVTCSSYVQVMITSMRGLFDAYSAGNGVVPNVSHIQIRAIFSTIYMHVDVIYDFVWTWQYAASRSVSPTKMSFNIHLSYIHTNMWRTHMSLKSGLPIYLPILLWVC